MISLLLNESLNISFQFLHDLLSIKSEQTLVINTKKEKKFWERVGDAVQKKVILVWSNRENLIQLKYTVIKRIDTHYKFFKVKW